MNAGAGVRIWLAFEPVDMRLAFDGLAAKVAHVLKQDPYDDHWFVFRSRSGTRIKILTFDGVGWWLHYRRLEAGTFVWPPVNGHGSIELSEVQFAVLAQGPDWRRVKVAELRVPTSVRSFATRSVATEGSSAQRTSVRGLGEPSSDRRSAPIPA